MSREYFFLAFRFSLAILTVWLALAGLVNAAESPAPRRVGVLLGAWSPESNEVQALRQGLQDAIPRNVMW